MEKYNKYNKYNYGHIDNGAQMVDGDSYYLNMCSLYSQYWLTVLLVEGKNHANR